MTLPKCAWLESVMTLEGADCSNAGSNNLVNRKCPTWLTPNCISKPSSVSDKGHAITPAIRSRQHNFLSSSRAHFSPAAHHYHSLYMRAKYSTSSVGSACQRQRRVLAAFAPRDPLLKVYIRGQIWSEHQDFTNTSWNMHYICNILYCFAPERYYPLCHVLMKIWLQSHALILMLLLLAVTC
jgi:hypothetical protein